MARKALKRYCEIRGLEVEDVVRLLDQKYGYSHDRKSYLYHGKMDWLDRQFGISASMDAQDGEPLPEGTNEEHPLTLRSDPLLGTSFGDAQDRRHVYVHFNDVFGEIESREAVARRLSLVLRHLMAFGRTSIVKGTRGNENSGWRRTPLGGGNQYYLWWAPQGAAPVQGLDLEPGAILARAVRHHDDHSALSCGSRKGQYKEVGAGILGDLNTCPLPWTEEQEGFIRSDAHIRVLCGAAGTGKTTALLDMMCTRMDTSVLFLTYSGELVDHCLEYCRVHPISGDISAITFPDVVRRIASRREIATEQGTHRIEFHRIASRLGARHLGPWTRHLDWLHGEMRAHLLGRALPVPFLDQSACPAIRISDDNYRERRTAELGTDAVECLLHVARVLDSQGKLETVFPQVVAARRALDRLLAAPEGDQLFRDVGIVDRIVVDEVQDLTLVEVYLVIEFAARLAREREGVPPFLAFAGDESQTVDATGFQWSWLNSLLHTRFGQRTQEHDLGRNVRSPGIIGELVNRSRYLYRHVDNDHRPRGRLQVEVEQHTFENVFFCRAATDEETSPLLRFLHGRDQATIVVFGPERPTYLPEGVTCLSPAQVKGLEYQMVCVLDAGAHIASITDKGSGYWRRDEAVVPLRKRMDVDRFRVAISRATETLIFLDVRPGEAGLHAIAELIDFEPQHCSPDDEAILAYLFTAQELARQLADEERSEEEKVHGYLTDARQLAETVPEEAVRKAWQARRLLGRRGAPGSVADETLRDEAVRVLSRLLFQRAASRAADDADAAIADLREAEKQARYVSDEQLVTAMRTVRRAVNPASSQLRARAMRELGYLTSEGGWTPPRWFLHALAPAFSSWLPDLEETIASAVRPLEAVLALSPCYRLAGLTDEMAGRRTQDVLAGVARGLVDRRKYHEALEIAVSQDPPIFDVVGVCHERLRDHKTAAKAYRQGGLHGDALRNYRAAGDLPGALEVVDLVTEDVPARSSLQWLSDVTKLPDATPVNARTLLRQGEQKLLRALLAETRGQAVATSSANPTDELPDIARDYVAATSWRDGELSQTPESLPIAIEVPAVEHADVRCLELIPSGPGADALVWLDRLARTLARRPPEASSLLGRPEKDLLARALRSIRETALGQAEEPPRTTTAAAPNDVDVDVEVDRDRPHPP